MTPELATILFEDDELLNNSEQVQFLEEKQGKTETYILVLYKLIQVESKLETLFKRIHGHSNF